jgi:hypothetical protein
MFWLCYTPRHLALKMYKRRTFSREQQFQILPLQIPQHAVVLADNGRRQVPLAAL